VSLINRRAHGGERCDATPKIKGMNAEEQQLLFEIYKHKLFGTQNASRQRQVLLMSYLFASM
jgi:hypothetical protein